MTKFKIVNDGDGFYTIKDVPVFETHDTRGFDCNEEWMRECIQNFERDKAAGHRPGIIIGHNVKGTEKENWGFLDNMKLVGKRLYADLTRVTRELKDKIVQNKYPSRSVEVLPNSKRILALAMLGGTTPFFALPQMVYENQEQSHWYKYRSSIMPKFNLNGANKNSGGGSETDLNTIVANALKSALPEAIQNYQQQTEEAEAPTIFSLTIPEAVQFCQENPNIQIFQAEDGNFYATGNEGEYYQIPQQVAQYGIIKRGIAKTIGRTKTIARAASNSSVAEAGHGLSQGFRYPGLVEGGGSKAQRVGAMAGRVSGTTRRGVAASVGAVKKHPYVAGGIGAAALAGGGYLAMGNNDNSRYQLDQSTGVVYFDGVPVGEVAMYNDTMAVGDQFPPQDTQDPILEVNPSATSPESDDDQSLSTNPGEPEGPFHQHVDRGSSDQFARSGDGSGELEAAEMYQLRQEVDQLKYANELLQISRSADGIKSYLLSLKQAGAPVGDIDKQLDFMLTLQPEQLKTYKHQLEGLPKISLGAMDGAGSQTYSLDDARVKQDYSANAQTYAKLGVGEEDLRYAGYVRTNRGVGDVSRNGNGNGTSFGN